MSIGKATRDAARKPQKDAVPSGAPGKSVRRRPAKSKSVPVTGIPEDEMTPRVQTVVSTLIDEVERLKRDLEDSQKRMVELASMADSDPLLGILNRRAFEREVGRAVAYARRYGTTLSVVYVDLNDFKTVNDRYGHRVGDAVLREVGGALDADVRESDIVGRIGGDEFAVVLVQSDYDNAALKAGRLVDAVAARSVEGPDGAIGISVTAGVATLVDGDSVESLMDRADKAMYAGKRSRQRA